MPLHTAVGQPTAEISAETEVFLYTLQMSCRTTTTIPSGQHTCLSACLHSGLTPGWEKPLAAAADALWLGTPSPIEPSAPARQIASSLIEQSAACVYFRQARRVCGQMRCITKGNAVLRKWQFFPCSEWSVQTVNRIDTSRREYSILA